LIPYAEFVRQYAGLAQERFLERVKEPHLLLFFPPKGAEPGETPFTTSKIDLHGGLTPETRAFVVPIRKSEGNAFGMMFTIGRAPNNDIVIKHPAISKFHAYLRQTGERWSICDADSMNSTALDGQRLAPEQAYPLRDGQVLQFGGAVVGEMLTPAELHQRLRLEHALGSTDPAESARHSEETMRVKWSSRLRDGNVEETQTLRASDLER